MKDYVITLDTGTTNTRVILWDRDRKIVAKARKEVGVRNTAIDGDNHKLKEAVRECIGKVLEDSGLTFAHVREIVASGMITSNVGLVEIPHCTAPIDEFGLSRAVVKVEMLDICPIPITFIPGVKNPVDKLGLNNFEAMDIMRGEEVEVVAVLEQFPSNQPYLIVLPGSHMKFVSVDEEGRIRGCLTSISGELLSSITHDTIIADAVGRQFVNQEDYDKKMVLLGYENAEKVGIGRACFSGRILNQFVTDDKKKIANYILGVTIQSDIQGIHYSRALLTDPRTEVIVSGRTPLAKAMVDVLRHDAYFKKVTEYKGEAEMPLSAVGAYRIVGL